MRQVTPPTAQAPARRDPAPSRAAYRLQRLWLTPGFRFLMRLGVPGALVFAGMGLYLSHDNNREVFVEKIAEIRRSVEERPEFMVKLMAIDGASDVLADDIREVLPLDFPISSFDLDLPAMQAQVAALDAVAKADLRVRPGGILQVQITERVPSVVWRSGEGLELLDVYGNHIATLAHRGLRPDLPLIAGDAANDAVAEGLRVLAAAAPISSRVRGLVRMGERRWDLVLDHDQRILLPEVAPAQALEQVIALSDAQELLDRDVMVIDMRNIARPTLRLAPLAREEMYRIKGLELGVKEE